MIQEIFNFAWNFCPQDYIPSSVVYAELMRSMVAQSADLKFIFDTVKQSPLMLAWVCGYERKNVPQENSNLVIRLLSRLQQMC